MGRPDVGRDDVHVVRLFDRRGGSGRGHGHAPRRLAVVPPVVPTFRSGIALAGVLLALAGARPTAHDPITTKVTFAREIRAILSARCTICHAPGGSAPMPLTTYEEVRPWARAIKE
jgi:hypothetical protein